MTAPQPAADGPDAVAVAAFLRDHPRFLADNPELYRRLAPPARVHGEALADHMAAMLGAERDHARRLSERADGVLAAGRAAAGLTARVHDAVVALILATDPAEFVQAELAGLLGIDAARLLGPPPRPLPPTTATGLLGGRSVVFRTFGEDRALLHAEAAELARHDALVRVPRATGVALLALAARDPHLLDPTQGTGALAFLGRALAAALDR